MYKFLHGLVIIDDNNENLFGAHACKIIPERFYARVWVINVAWF